MKFILPPCHLFIMHQITAADLIIDVVRKPIKNLHLGVYPPDGRARIAAPQRVSDEAIRAELNQLVLDEHVQ